MKLVVQGREAYAYTGGKPFDRALPCIVFIHGALHDHSVWTLLARWCAHHGHAVLALDHPAHGRSEGPPCASVEALAEWTLALLDAAGVPAATLVGHSLGALVALEAAGRAPERVRHLAMLGVAYPMAVSPALLERGREAPLAAIDDVNTWSHATTAAKPAYPGPGAWLHGGNRALMRRTFAGWTGTNLFVHDFRLCDDYRGGLAAAAKVACPVTFVLAERDQMTNPKSATELAQALSARVVTVPGGHSLMQEQPDAVLNALKDALRAA